MTSNVVNRELIRDHLASLLDTKLGSGGSDIVQEVFNYKTDNFDGKTPVVVVCSRGSDRRKMAEVSVVTTDVLMYIYIFVLYSDGEDWGADDSEDRLDLIEKQIHDCLADNFYQEGYWISIGIDQQSQIEPIVIGDEMYQREMMFISAEAYSD